MKSDQRASLFLTIVGAFLVFMAARSAVNGYLAIGLFLGGLVGIIVNALVARDTREHSSGSGWGFGVLFALAIGVTTASRMFPHVKPLLFGAAGACSLVMGLGVFMQSKKQGYDSPEDSRA